MPTIILRAWSQSRVCATKWPSRPMLVRMRVTVWVFV